MDTMKIDDKALDELSKIIKSHCQKQAETIKNYRRAIGMLEDRWDSDPFERLLSKAIEIENNTTKSESAISQHYSVYYSKKADMIRTRPSFSGTSSSSTSTSYSGSTSSRNGTKSFFDKVFENYNKEFRDSIYTYLRRINFYVPNDRISFYDPFGTSKNGLYDNIMAIDIKSDTFNDDLLSLTGQHVFFMMDHSNKMNIIRCLGDELKSKLWGNDIAFNDLTKQIVEGKGINHSHLSFDDNSSKYAFNFFSQAFKATLNNDIDLTNKYKKYFSNSYGQFMNILHNLNY